MVPVLKSLQSKYEKKSGYWHTREPKETILVIMIGMNCINSDLRPVTSRIKLKTDPPISVILYKCLFDFVFKLALWLQWATFIFFYFYILNNWLLWGILRRIFSNMNWWWIKQAEGVILLPGQRDLYSNLSVGAFVFGQNKNSFVWQFFK